MIPRLRILKLQTPLQPPIVPRHISCASTAYYAKPMPPRPKVSEEDIEEAFLKGRYFGAAADRGDRKNKTNSAVQLKHIPTGIVIKSQATRSRAQNRKIARGLLAEKLEEMEKGEESRVAKLRERDQKKKASKSKKAKRKYKKLELEKSTTAAEKDLVVDLIERIEDLNTRQREEIQQEGEQITTSHSADHTRIPKGEEKV